MPGLDITYFLTIQTWAEYGYTDINTDKKKLKPIIQAVQRTRIEPVIGTKLYDKLVELIIADNVTGLYKEVLEKHIIPTMIAFCDYKATWHTTIQITNKTTGSNNDEHIRAADQKSANDLRGEIIKDATSYMNKLKAWICDNWNDVPELFQSPEADQLRSTLPADPKAPNDYFGNISII